MEEKEYYTVAELAQKLEMHHMFVRKLLRENKLAYYKVGSHIRIKPEDVEVYLQNNRVEAK